MVIRRRQASALNKHRGSLSKSRPARVAHSSVSASARPKQPSPELTSTLMARSRRSVAGSARMAASIG